MKARIWNYSGPTTTFDWDTLNPINLSWANAGMQQIKMATAELVHPLLLKRDSLTPLNVHFAREDDSWSKLFKEHGEKRGRLRFNDCGFLRHGQRILNRLRVFG